MRIPPFVLLISYAGLVPALAGPIWRLVSPDSMPPWADGLWASYIQLLAAFLAGTFWGFALPAMEGVAGMAGMVIAAVLMLLTLAATRLAFEPSLQVLAGVFLLLLAAEFWRERFLGTIEGYFRLRAVLTLTTVAAIALRLFLD
ncbi:MAG TPA: DUF3429 domain-containing protein [Nevskiaceae bacterium]|nr:DUF3429 domain-containing protein [Nevskiaceae bacterium]